MVTFRMWTTPSYCTLTLGLVLNENVNTMYKRSFLRHILHLAIDEGYIYSKLTIRIFYFPNDITQNQTINFQNKINNPVFTMYKCIHTRNTLADLDCVMIKIDTHIHVKKSQIPNIVITSRFPKNWISYVLY